MRQVASACLAFVLLGNLTPALAVADADYDDAAGTSDVREACALDGAVLSGQAHDAAIELPSAEKETQGVEAQDAETLESASVSEADATLTESKLVPQSQVELEAQAEEPALDPVNLANGTYGVSVSLMKSSDIGSPSMAASAFDGCATLTVKNGAYSLAVSLGSVQVGSVTGHIDRLAYYESYSVSGNSLVISGASTPVFAASGEGDGGPANIPVMQTGKESGYLALELWSSAMGTTSQDAALKIDWTSLSQMSNEVNDGAFSTSGDLSAPIQTEPSTASADEAQPMKFGGIYEVGHVYKVPISFKKSGSSETSMAGQYFGGYAYVRPQSDGSFDVRFSTNRPDYILSLSYNGSPASVTSESSSSREYAISMDQTTDEAIASLSISVKPMVELGAGAQDVDMHVFFGSATDLGVDTGQVASSASTAGTGDSSRQNMAPLVPMAALSIVAAIAIAIYRRNNLED